jgi:hypothetical protein
MHDIAFILAELAFLAATHFFGGPPWTVIGTVAFIAQVFIGFRTAPLAMLAPSLFWLAGFHATGNRELFFPFTMYLSSFVAVQLADRSMGLGACGGSMVVCVFMVIRTLQNATPRVLAFELLLASLILAGVLLAHRLAPKRPLWSAVIVVVSSFLAYACLSL